MKRGFWLLIFIIIPDQIFTWNNGYDQPLHFDCPSNSAISYISSKHHNGAEDRVWSLSCRNIGKVGNCRWSGFVNQFDAPFAFQCPGRGFITGIFSYHDNYPEDRRHKFKCCEKTGNILSNCYNTGFTGFDAYFRFSIPRGYVLRGVTSYHHDGAEDRRFSFMFCRLAKCGK